jgi:hypothetical protein
MKEERTGSSKKRAKRERVHQSCKPFILEVDRLLVARKAAKYLDLRWTLARLWSDLDCRDAYLFMLSGGRKSAPNRDFVLKLADWFYCSVAERNVLLVAAGHAPVPAAPASPIVNEQPSAALPPDLAARLRSDSAPAYALGRDWLIIDWNRPCLALFDLTPEQASSIPVPDRNLLQLLVDPAHPVFDRLHYEPNIWFRTVLLNIHVFKQANHLCVTEPWYLRTVERLRRFPTLDKLWDSVSLADSPPTDPTGATALQLYATQIRSHELNIRVIGNHIKTVHADYPVLVSYEPYCREDVDKFLSIGLTVSVAKQDGRRTASSADAASSCIWKAEANHLFLPSAPCTPCSLPS